jgi:predicted N-formylglutamate amidohydrolase
MKYVVSCEHASAALPEEYGTLGLGAGALHSHIAWDPGAAEIAKALADRLGAPCELGGWSRLLVDLNRSETNPNVVPAVAFGVLVPGNQLLPMREIEARIARYHRPYWDTVERLVRVEPCVHISIHSFTPDIEPEKRQFDVGLLFDREDVSPLASALRQRGYSVEHNQPYPGSMDLITTAMRARVSGYVGIEIELNQAMMKGAWQGALVDAIVVGIT